MMYDTYYTEHTISGNLFFLCKGDQNHQPTLVSNSKYLAIPPTPLLLRNIKMDPKARFENPRISRGFYENFYIRNSRRGEQTRI